MMNVYENVCETVRYAQNLRHHAQNNKHKEIGMFDKIEKGGEYNAISRSN